VAKLLLPASKRRHQVASKPRPRLVI
jgi:hypothetical protein